MRLVLIVVGRRAASSRCSAPRCSSGSCASHGYAQAIRVSTADEPYPEHEGKRGTPSMGGLAILAGLHRRLHRGAPDRAGARRRSRACSPCTSRSASAAVGIADDYLKIFKQRSTGVRARTKLLGQAAVALSFAWLALQLPRLGRAARRPRTRSRSCATPGSCCPTALFMLWIWFLVTATTNAVNLTDGLDGLAAGAAVMTLGAYTLLSAVAVRPELLVRRVRPLLRRPRSARPRGLRGSGRRGAASASCGGTRRPASIFMGDTGSLALGGAIAALAILSRTELLLPLLAGLFLIITLSVIGQVGSYKLTGRRMFRMAPLHHHFEMLGLGRRSRSSSGSGSSTGCSSRSALGLFYAEWVRRP